MKKFLIAAAAVVLAAMAVPAIAATNPFMDVPASHWAYDAVAQLASRGVISGYPDGTFKGQQPITRYEVASIIARSLAYVDADKASKQDVEMLKRLIVEFSDELSALGVTVDGFDSRLGQLETDIGGWKLSGVFEFNAKIGSNGKIGDLDSHAGLDGAVDFDLDKYRIYLDKRINETTSFHSRIARQNSKLGSYSISPSGHGDGRMSLAWDWYYITTKLGYDITLDVGRFNFDWESDLGLVTDDDSFVGDWTAQQFRFTKDWGMANLQLVFGRMGDDYGTTATSPNEEAFLLAGLADFNFNEKFRAGVMAYYVFADNSYPVGDAENALWLGVYAKFRFHPSVELKGIYYYESWNNQAPNDTDDANAWKVILKAEQDLLKFTDLQLEYAQIENSFYLWNAPYDSIGNALLDNRLYADDDKTTKVYGVKAAQKWGETKWNSWIRYYHADYGTTDLDDVNNYGIGIGYQLNPAVHFELAYDYIDFGDSITSNFGGLVDNDHVIRFQTLVNF